MSTSLLLAEPEPVTRGFLDRHLTDDGFDVLHADGGSEALEIVERQGPELLLLDAVLRDEPGTEVCRRLREGEPGRSWNRNLPVIVLGETESDAFDRVRAFARGCDDFVSKPFHYDELVARIRAVLRRASPPPAERVEADGLVIDQPTRRVSVRGEGITLAGKEYELLLKLASDPLRVFTKEELLRDVWGFMARGRTRTLDSHASRLRRKLARPGAPAYVVNEWGVGYRLLGDRVLCSELV